MLRAIGQVIDVSFTGMVLLVWLLFSQPELQTWKMVKKCGPGSYRSKILFFLFLILFFPFSLLPESTLSSYVYWKGGLTITVNLFYYKSQQKKHELDHGVW